MITARFGRLPSLILVVALAFRCTSDSITGGDIPDPGNPSDPGDPSGVRVTLIPRTLELAVYDIAKLTVIVRDANGEAIVSPEVIYSISGLPAGTVDGAGLVTALPGGCGIGRITAKYGGVTSNESVVTVGSTSASGCGVNPGSEGVGSVSLPESLSVEVYGSERLTPVVRDTTGAVIDDPQVVFSAIGLPAGTVDSTGLVTGLPGRCGVGSVVAWSGSVRSNTAVVTIGSPSGAGCWDY